MNAVPQAAERDWRTPLELTLLGAIWGCSFLFMRVAVPSFGPFALVEVRLVLGALVLLPFLWRARAQFPPRRWLWLAPIGLINSALPFVLFAYAAEQAPAAIGAICNAMTVLFAALIAFLFFGEKIGMRRAGALLVGFAGVVVLATAKVSGLSIGTAVLAGAAASLLYGLGVNLVKRHGWSPSSRHGRCSSPAAFPVLRRRAPRRPRYGPGACAGCCGPGRGCSPRHGLRRHRCGFPGGPRAGG